MKPFSTFSEFRSWAYDNANGPVSGYIYRSGPRGAIDTYWFDYRNPK